MRPVLIATGDSQTLTVSRVTSNYAWGSWDVILPDNVDKPEEDDRNSAGYIYEIQNATSKGLFDRRFVRADAKIDMKNGDSTLEKVLNNCEKRIVGSVNLEREITRDGCGYYEPRSRFPHKFTC